MQADMVLYTLTCVIHTDMDLYTLTWC